MAKKKVKTKNYLRGDVKKAKSKRAKLLKYAKENPAEAAALGLMAVPVVGWGAAGAIRTATGAAKLYKKRKLIKGAAKKVYEKVKTKVGPTVKKAGEKLTKAYGPKHKHHKKTFSTRGAAEKARTMGKSSSQYKTVRLKDKKIEHKLKADPKFGKGEGKSRGLKGVERTYTKKQYGIRPTGRAAATSRGAIGTVGVATYIGSQLMSKKTSKPKKKTNGKGPGKSPGSVPSQQGKGTGSYKDRDSAGPNAIAQPIKRPRPKKKSVGPRKYKPGTSGGDRPATRMHGSEIFRKRLGGQRKPGSRGGY
jgi:hypothetical protein